MTEDELKDKITEIHSKLIYHGRHFSPSRDKVVLDKSIGAILSVLRESGWYHLDDEIGGGGE